MFYFLLQGFSFLLQTHIQLSENAADFTNSLSGHDVEDGSQLDLQETEQEGKGECNFPAISPKQR